MYLLGLAPVHHYRSYWSFNTIPSAISFISDTPSCQIWNFLLCYSWINLSDGPVCVRHAAERELRASPSLAKITWRHHAAFKLQCVLVSWWSSAVVRMRCFLACGQYRRLTGTVGQVELLCPRKDNRHCCKHQQQDWRWNSHARWKTFSGWNSYLLLLFWGYDKCQPHPSLASWSLCHVSKCQKSLWPPVVFRDQLQSYHLHKLVKDPRD